MQITIHQTIEALDKIQKDIKEQKKIIDAMKKEQTTLLSEIQQFLINDKNHEKLKTKNGILVLVEKEKKFNLSQKAYNLKVKNVLYSQGLQTDDVFIKNLLDKTDKVIKQQTVKIEKV
jgi:hypothetical protein